ncbi:MAG: FkbM family methyltransferase [bacterium]|nr:FkbM family methyltransferase [bacterium]
MTRIASFHKGVIAHSLIKKIPRGANPDDYIEATPVRMMDFSQLVRECDIEKIDLLQLDCEGYDYEVLKMVDFDRFSPSLINYESTHFSDQTRKECEDTLVSKGYRLFRYGSDTCAYKI